MAMVRFGDTILNILGNYKRCLGILIKIDKKFLAFFAIFNSITWYNTIYFSAVNPIDNKWNPNGRLFI